MNINWFNMLGQFFFLIVLFMIILAAAYYVTRLLGRFQHQKYKTCNIKIIESIAIAPQKTLQLIKVGNKVYLIGITKDNIVYLSEIDGEIIHELELDDVGVLNPKFDKYLNLWLDKFKDKGKNKDTGSDGEVRDENE
ncbi:MAG: flagellar biosynthetic protein FliO [Epulopiscium sp.]|nr:flagellar biosynthetic protein FliO [Candidatus Epulonipiscium sp.]